MTVTAWQDEAAEDGKRGRWQCNLPGRRVQGGVAVTSWGSSLWSYNKAGKFGTVVSLPSSVVLFL